MVDLLESTVEGVHLTLGQYPLAEIVSQKLLVFQQTPSDNPTEVNLNAVDINLDSLVLQHSQVAATPVNVIGYENWLLPALDLVTGLPDSRDGLLRPMARVSHREFREEISVTDRMGGNEWEHWSVAANMTGI